MRQRHFARIIALQILYQLDFLGLLDQGKGSVENKKEKEILNQYLKKFFLSAKTTENDFPISVSSDENFVKKLVLEILVNQKEIDQRIKKFAPEWPIKQISTIDRNILRIGIFEIIFLKETPNKVAIDEAIELAKIFGSETSGRFVNGVLGTIYEKIKKEENH